MHDTAPVTDASVGTHLRMHLPTPVARGLEAAVSKVGQPGERLSRRIAFVERLLRFLVAVQEPLRAHLGLARPKAVRDLLQRLDRPTMGLWGHAVEALSLTLAPREDSALAQALFQAIQSHSDPSDLFLGCSAIIAIRNEVAHSSDLACIPVKDARNCLMRTRAPLHRLIRGLEPLCRVDLVVPILEDQSLLGHTHLQLLRYRGLTPSVIELTDAGARPPVKLPMLVHDDGSLIPLYPWLVHQRKGATGTLCSIVRWDQNGPWVEALDAPEHRIDGPPDSVPSPQALQGLPKLQPPLPSRWKLAPHALQGLQLPLSPVDAPPQVRDLIARRLLGRGGAGSVWAVEDPSRPNTPLALKVLHARMARVPGAVARLRREFDLLKSLGTDGVVHVEELIEDTKLGPCLLMERVEGESLAAVLARGPLKIDRAVSLILDILDTLAQVHLHGVVHRDLKPSNIMVSGNQTRVLDFGVARVANAQPLTRTGDVLGTRNYAAPEQLDGEPATNAADLYAMGLLLADLIRGGRFRDSKLPGNIAPIVRRATSKRPTDRYDSAQDMAKALRRACQRNRQACALLAGETLPGGLRLDGEPSPIGEHLFILSAKTSTGTDAAVLAPSSEGSAAVLIYRLRDQLEPTTLHRWTRSRVQVTEDGVPWVELSMPQPEKAALHLLHALQVPGGTPPPVQLEPDPPTPEDAPPASEPSAPPPKPDSVGAKKTDNQAATQLGLLAAGALAGALLARSPKARSVVAQPSLAMMGLGPMTGLLGMVSKNRRKSKRAARVKPRPPNPLECLRHRYLLLLAWEEGMQQASHLNEAAWQAAWGQPLGGLHALLHTRWTLPAILRPRLMSAPTWPAVAPLLPPLRAGGSLGTADVAPLSKAFEHAVQGLTLPEGRAERTTPWLRVQGTNLLLRQARKRDGWQSI